MLITARTTGVQTVVMNGARYADLPPLLRYWQLILKYFPYKPSSAR